MKNPEIKFGVLEGQTLLIFKGATSIELTAKAYLTRKMREQFGDIENFKERVKAYVADWLEYYKEINDSEEIIYDTKVVIGEVAEHLTHSDGMLIDRIKRETASHDDQDKFSNSLKSIMTMAHK